MVGFTLEPRPGQAPLCAYLGDLLLVDKRIDELRGGWRSLSSTMLSGWMDGWIDVVVVKVVVVVIIIIIVVVVVVVVVVKLN